MPDTLFYLITSLMYVALAVYYWRTRWVAAPQAELVTPGAARVEHLLVLAPMIAQGVLLYESMLAGDGMHLGVGNTISVVVWLTVVIHWCGAWFYNLQGLQSMAMPVSAVAVLMPMVFPPTHPLVNSGSPALEAHLLIAIVAYSLFTIAALHVALMVLLERRLHGGNLPMMLQKLPPLLTMESLLFRIIAAGFALLTLTLATGIFFSEELFGRPLRFDHKTVFSILSWVVFAALLGGRWFYGWRGRIAVRWTMTGFVMLVLAYIGSKFVLEVLLGRG
jgi:ABC-type uncharacterized transport system permease subunit